MCVVFVNISLDLIQNFKSIQIILEDHLCPPLPLLFRVCIFSTKKNILKTIENLKFHFRLLEQSPQIHFTSVYHNDIKIFNWQFLNCKFYTKFIKFIFDVRKSIHISFLDFDFAPNRFIQFRTVIKQIQKVIEIYLAVRAKPAGGVTARTDRFFLSAKRKSRGVLAARKRCCCDSFELFSSIRPRKF